MAGCGSATVCLLRYLYGLYQPQLVTIQHLSTAPFTANAARPFFEPYYEYEASVRVWQRSVNPAAPIVAPLQHPDYSYYDASLGICPEVGAPCRK